jgi:hypothetical protein
MLQDILTHYFTRPPSTTAPLTITLDVATHQPHRDNTKFRVSDAGKCPRMRVWKRQGKDAHPQPLSVEVALALQTGNLLHAFIEYALEAEGVLAAVEVPLEDAHRLGHLDAVVKDGDKLLLYDFKTVGGKQMYYLKNEGRPKLEHLAQVLTYYTMYQDNVGDLDGCRIAYVSRDTLEILDMAVDLQSLPLVHGDWRALLGYWERQETPPVTAQHWECKYCQYQTACLPGG